MVMRYSFLLLLITFFSANAQVSYEADLAYYQMEIGPEIVFTFMPDFESDKAKEVLAKYDKPEAVTSFTAYNPFEAYLQDLFYEDIKQALSDRFGIKIRSKVSAAKKKDSTVYGYPILNAGKCSALSDAHYFVKINLKISSLESANLSDGQPADQSTLSPTMSIGLTLYDKEGKKVKKASGKIQTTHFVKGRVEDAILWDGKTRLRGFKADISIMETYLPQLLRRTLGKLQESFYK